MINPNSNIPHWELPKYYEQALNHYKQKNCYNYIYSTAGEFMIYKIPIELIHYAFKYGTIERNVERNFYSITIELRSLVKMHSKKIKKIAASLLLADLTVMYIEYAGKEEFLSRIIYAKNNKTKVRL